jgi:hypothetical protein
MWAFFVVMFGDVEIAGLPQRGAGIFERSILFVADLGLSARCRSVIGECLKALLELWNSANGPDVAG